MLIDVTPHRTLNTSKGVVKCPQLKGDTEETILDELSSQKVTSVKRISITKSSETIQTNTLILTFSTSTVPKVIQFGYLNVKVNVYVPNPLRCFLCQRFGHHEQKCQSKAPVCGKCAGVHRTESCPGLSENNPQKCAGCGGDHPAYAKTCPKWQTEKEILRVKYTTIITFQ